MSRRDRSRRSFLKSVGASAAALPFFSMLEASAAGEGQALRFIGIFHPHGAASPLFTMRAGETETSFELRGNDSLLSPFDDAATYGRSFKDKLLILEGIDLAASVASGTEGHAAPSCILTGSGGTPAHRSIDQYLAEERGLGSATRLSSLVLGVGDGNTSVDASISFGAGGAPLSKIIDPRATFATLFDGFADPADPVALAKAERNRQRGLSAIDYLRGDLTRLRSRLASAEKTKLEQHLTAVRELEKRLAALPASQACSVPGKPREFPSVRSYNNGEPYFEEITNLQVDLLAQAMACDLTRFATLWLADLSRGASANTGLANVPEDCHSGLAHQYVGPRDSQAGTPSTWSALGVQNRYSYSKAARLLQKLAAADILEETFVLMSGEMGDPNMHSSRNVPMLLAGGCGGKFRMGRRLKMVNDCPPDQYYCQSPALVSNNKVLVSIARAFGLADVEKFGTAANAAITTGELPGLV